MNELLKCIAPLQNFLSISNTLRIFNLSLPCAVPLRASNQQPPQAREYEVNFTDSSVLWKADLCPHETQHPCYFGPKPPDWTEQQYAHNMSYLFSVCVGSIVLLLNRKLIVHAPDRNLSAAVLIGFSLIVLLLPYFPDYKAHVKAFNFLKKLQCTL